MNNIRILIDGVNGGHLDLFDNENIELVVKNKDLKDISKMFSDYVKSFSIPATDNNRKLLGYKMDSNVKYNESISNRASIYINDMVFKKGYIDVLESKVTNGKEEYIKINFYTGVAEIKDIIGDTKLSELDFSKYKFNWSNQQVGIYLDRETANSFFGTDKLLLPLISNTRAWNFGQGGENDISTDAGRIKVSELTPCLHAPLVFDVIFEELFIKKGYKRPHFNFLTSKDMEDTYVLLNGNRGDTKTELLLKNTNQYVVTGNLKRPFIFYAEQGGDNWTTIDIDNTEAYNSLMYSDYSFDIRNIVDTVTLERYQKELTVTIEYKDSGIIQYASGTPDGNGNLKLGLRAYNSLKGIKAFRIKVNAESDVRFDLFQTKVQTVSRPSSNAYLSSVYTKDEYGTSQFGEYIFNIAGGFGDMKVLDFVSSFLKMCNGSILADAWNEGAFVFATSKEIENPVAPSLFTNQTFDITPYVDSDDYLKRTQTKYKDFLIGFKESKYYRNKAYKSVTKKEYGSEYFDTKRRFVKDSYSVEIGVNILPYFLMEGTNNLVTGYTFEENGNKATSSTPTLVIMNKKTTVIQDSNGNDVNIKFDDGRGFVSHITRYTEAQNHNGNLSITYDEHITAYGEFIPFNLFGYYKKDIETINNDNVFYYDLNVNIEPSLLLFLNTNSVILLNGRYVKIEELNISLTTGKGKMTVYDYEERYKIHSDLPPTPDYLNVDTIDLQGTRNKSVLFSWGYIAGDFNRYQIEVLDSGGRVYSSETIDRRNAINDTMHYMDFEKNEALDSNILYFASIRTINEHDLVSSPRGSQPFSVKK